MFQLQSWILPGLGRGGDGATVQQKYHAKKQSKSGQQKSEDSVVQRALRCGSGRRRGRIAKSAALRVSATRRAKQRENNQKCDSRTHLAFRRTGARACPVSFEFYPATGPIIRANSSREQENPRRGGLAIRSACPAQWGLSCSSRKASGKKKINIMQIQKIIAGTSHNTSENFSYFKCMK